MHAWDSMLMMKPHTVTRIAWAVALGVMCLTFAALPIRVFAGSEAGNAATTSSACTRVRIDSVEQPVCVRKSEIAGLARARGLSGPIDYVRIATPASMGQEMHIRRMIILSSAGRTSRDTVVCSSGLDISMAESTQCSVNLSAPQLQLVVTFEPATTLHQAKLFTQQIAKYTMRHVLCRHEEPAKKE